MQYRKINSKLPAVNITGKIRTLLHIPTRSKVIYNRARTNCYYLNVEFNWKTCWLRLCSKHSMYCLHCNSRQQLNSSIMESVTNTKYNNTRQKSRFQQTQHISIRRDNFVTRSKCTNSVVDSKQS